MKISELIEKLGELKDSHGDIEVYSGTSDRFGYYDIAPVTNVYLGSEANLIIDAE